MNQLRIRSTKRKRTSKTSTKREQTVQTSPSSFLSSPNSRVPFALVRSAASFPTSSGFLFSDFLLLHHAVSNSCLSLSLSSLLSLGFSYFFLAFLPFCFSPTLSPCYSSSHSLCLSFFSFHSGLSVSSLFLFSFQTSLSVSSIPLSLRLRFTLSFWLSRSLTLADLPSASLSTQNLSFSLVLDSQLLSLCTYFPDVHPSSSSCFSCFSKSALALSSIGSSLSRVLLPFFHSSLFHLFFSLFISFLEFSL